MTIHRRLLVAALALAAGSAAAQGPILAPRASVRALPIAALRLPGAALAARPALTAPAPLAAAPKARLGQFRALPQGLTNARQALKHASAAFDGARSLAADDFSRLRYPYGDEANKIRMAVGAAKQRSPLLNGVLDEFERQGGRYYVSDDDGLYHARAMGTPHRDAAIVVSRHMFDPRGITWAFLASMLGREATYASDFFGTIPASAEKLAVAYAYGVLGFAEATNSSSRPQSWATDMDHDHAGRGDWFEWGYYSRLLTTLSMSFIDSDFFRHIRDVTARETNRAEAYQYSLYEQYTGQYWRPGESRHQQPLPATAPRLDEATYNAASAKVYGQDGEGGHGDGRGDTTDNFLGLMRTTLRRLEGR